MSVCLPEDRTNAIRPFLEVWKPLTGVSSRARSHASTNPRVARRQAPTDTAIALGRRAHILLAPPHSGRRFMGTSTTTGSGAIVALGLPPVGSRPRPRVPSLNIAPAEQASGAELGARALGNGGCGMSMLSRHGSFPPQPSNPSGPWLLACLVGVMIVACAPPSSDEEAREAQGPIVVGSAMPLTGPFASD